MGATRATGGYPASSWQGQSSQGTRRLIPPEKFEPSAPIPSPSSGSGQVQSPTREDTITFGGTSATLRNAVWDVVDLVHM
eukprot:3818113-Prorocentrum_lima.AAC.1